MSARMSAATCDQRCSGLRRSIRSRRSSRLIVVICTAPLTSTNSTLQLRRTLDVYRCIKRYTAGISSSAEETATVEPTREMAETAQVQVTTASIENEFPHWKVWIGADELFHACIPWDTNMYVTAETLAGLRNAIIGCLRGREFALNQLKDTGAVSPPMFLGERHDFRVQEARKALAGNCPDVDKLRNHVRLLLQLADDWADTEVNDERTYTLSWGGLHIRAQDMSVLCQTCSSKLTELESKGYDVNSGRSAG
jgi:hypothetical protein